MSIGTALLTLWFPVLVFRNLVGCFTRPGLVFRNRPMVLFQLVFGGKSAFLVSAAALFSLKLAGRSGSLHCYVTIVCLRCMMII